MTTLDSLPGRVRTSCRYDGSEETTPFAGDADTPVPHLDTIAARGDGYDADAAFLLAMISTWAYADERVLAAKLRYYGLRGARITRFTVRNSALLVDTTGYLIRSPSGRSGVLAFRGTEPDSLIDVLTDLQTNQRPFFGGAVHQGFFLAAEVVWDDVHGLLAAATATDRARDADETGAPPPEPLSSLYVTGHSLGGAIALLVAARLHERRGAYDVGLATGIVRGVYTFGQPMVGDDRFADRVESQLGAKLHRHVFRNDPVPHLPPRAGVRYAHAGAERHERQRSPATRLLAALPANPALEPVRGSLRRVGQRLSWLNGWPQREAGYRGWDAPGERSRAMGIAGLPLLLVNAAETRLTMGDWVPGPALDDHSPINYVEVCRRSRRDAGQTASQTATQAAQ